VILLTGRERDYFSGAWGARQIVVIPHGVDSEFFCPGTGPFEPSILVVGRFLRDFALTAAAVLHMARLHPDWRFDFVVPAATWHGSELESLRGLPAVRWHDRVDDAALRRLYRHSTCHLIPFQDCSANNAIVESLACGLPIVTSDRGGVRDYGAGSVYPLAAEHTVGALASQCERYVAEPAWRAAVSGACRAFAVATLAWPIIARRHLDLYREVAHAKLAAAKLSLASAARISGP
jgi:glycosyltransferase involved in cell wall biosynthesis